MWATGITTRVVPTEINPKDANSSFVRGVNTIWAFMFVKVSPRWPPRFAPRKGYIGSTPAATQRRRQWNARQLAGCALCRGNQVHLKGASAVLGVHLWGLDCGLNKLARRMKCTQCDGRRVTVQGCYIWRDLGQTADEAIALRFPDGVPADSTLVILQRLESSDEVPTPSIVGMTLPVLPAPRRYGNVAAGPSDHSQPRVLLSGKVEPGWDFWRGASRYSKMAWTSLGSRARYWWPRCHKVARWSPVKRYRPELVTAFNISRQKPQSGEPGRKGQLASALSRRLSSTVIGASRKISSRDIFASLPPVNGVSRADRVRSDAIGLLT